MNGNSILVQNLSKTFSNFTLDNVSFCVPKGRIVGFIGENGAGKSTTINLILNQLKIDSGKIEINGKNNIQYLKKENIGVVFDECVFHEKFNAIDIEKILSGIYKTWDTIIYHQYLQKLKIPKDKQVGTFSKGMKMKLSIIAALSHRPQILILDEATSGLDPVVRNEILDLFLDFIQDENHSIFFSSHITSDIEKIADYVILIHNGRIIFEELKDNLVYNFGVLRCKKNDFANISQDDYIAFRETNVNMECLIKSKLEAKSKYKNVVIDNVTLEDIMLFYVKGELL